MSDALVAFLGSVGLCEGLSASELADFAEILEPHTYVAGAVLCQEGESGSTMFLIESGQVALTACLAGGDEQELAELGPGAVIGEMALVDGGPRSATATAKTDTLAYVASREGVSARRMVGNTAIGKVIVRLATTAAQRLLVTQQALGACSTWVAASKDVRQAREPSIPQEAVWRALPIFSDWSPSNIIELFQGGSHFELAPGVLLHHPDAPANSLYLVLSGAVEMRIERQAGTAVLSVLGPGRIVGACGALGQPTHLTSYVAREQTTVLELSAERVDKWIAGTKRMDRRFQDAVCQQVFEELRNANRRRAWYAACEIRFQI